MTKDSKTIPLTQGKHAIVDAEDYEWLSLYKWQYHSGYATRSVYVPGKNPKTIRMHRVITEAKKGLQVDHINSNRLDNRRSNLRVCTHAENMHNRGTMPNNKSGFIGVSWVKRERRWWAYISVNGKNKSLRYHNTATQAARARDEAALALHGEFALLNFGGTNG